MMKIRFLNAAVWKINTRPLGMLAARARRNIKTRSGTVNVIFIDDRKMKALNKTYRQKNKPTDVLSFNYKKDKEGRLDLMGEIYISIETARRQAKKNSEPFQSELNKLFVHGILHLHGYDHEKDSDYIKMHALECKILKRELPLYLNKK